MQFDNVWVPEEFEILNLSADLSDNIQVFYFLPIQDFDGNLVSGQLVLSNYIRQVYRLLQQNPNRWVGGGEEGALTFHFPERPDSQRLPEYIVPDLDQWFLLRQ